MKIENIKNKEGELLTTKTGEELQKFTFESGDEFIPEHNNIIIKSHKVKIDEKIRTINEYVLLCTVKNKEGKLILTNSGSDKIFVNLTPAQFNSLNKKLNNNMEINQRLFCAYLYNIKDEETNEVSSYIGIGFKSEFKKAKSFEDFESNEGEKEDIASDNI